MSSRSVLFARVSALRPLSLRLLSSDSKKPPPPQTPSSLPLTQGHHPKDFLGVDLSSIGHDGIDLMEEWEQEPRRDDFYEKAYVPPKSHPSGSASPQGGPFSHLDGEGRARMVDVSAKAITAREALAETFVTFPPTVYALLRAQQLPKGDALTAAHIAGVQAAKRTAELIPLCHSLPLTQVHLDFDPDDRERRLRIRARVRCVAQTGCEMEALTAASVAALTIYDMAKSASKDIVLGPLRLLAKSGGKSGNVGPARDVRDREVFGE